MIFNVQSAMHQIMLPGETEESPSFEILKARFHKHAWNSLGITGPSLEPSQKTFSNPIVCLLFKGLLMILL